jgi:hypothetical protein
LPKARIRKSTFAGKTGHKYDSIRLACYLNKIQHAHKYGT